MRKNREKIPDDSIASFVMVTLSVNIIYGIEKYIEDKSSKSQFREQTVFIKKICL